jgi:mitofilin
LSAFGYGLGVYYALTSDNWHDFFTEYIPGGEEAVAYFEEREFRKRFINRRNQETRLHPQIRGEEKVNISGRSGVSARTADLSGKADTKGPQVSALEKTDHAEVASKASAEQKESKTTQSTTHNLLPKDEPKPEVKESATKAAEPASEPPKQETTKLIDNLKIDNATEPVVQDVVKILNDIIIVINADKAAGKYSSTIDKAKGDLSKVVADIELLKQQEQKASADKLQAIHAEFDEAARELLRRQEQQIQDLEMRWREEYEAERGNLSRAYDHKLQSELDSANKVYEQKVRNELLKQAIALRRDFATSVKDTVETERSGRLGKLDELSSNVQELERLTGEWNAVVDSNLRTQHLLVAVEAVRATLENADRPKPFIEELAALKEVAADDSVVNAAIASINPTAYQRGIPSSAQLIDRFRRVSEEVRKASLLPDNAGVASHAASILLSKVMFKKAGLPVGDDVESILTRTEVLLEEGNLEDAVREMNSLTGWAKTLSRDWLAESRKVLEVQQALDVSISAFNLLGNINTNFFIGYCYRGPVAELTCRLSGGPFYCIVSIFYKGRLVKRIESDLLSISFGIPLNESEVLGRPSRYL